MVHHDRAIVPKYQLDRKSTSRSVVRAAEPAPSPSTPQPPGSGAAGAAPAPP
jgi:hypothetical protein